ncbi:hypothetical protein OK006_2763 [Actinobacteria bacterium OK006]|nr:hypothetical protein OK006_2763 [Actinobacteria bacterium OK006]
MPVVEVEGGGDRVDHLRRRAGLAALFQAHVVVGAHTREHGDLLAAQPRYPPAAVLRQSHVLRLERFTPCSEELSQRSAVAHEPHLVMIRVMASFSFASARVGSRDPGPGTPRKHRAGSYQVSRSQSVPLVVSCAGTGPALSEPSRARASADVLPGSAW